MAQLRTHYQNGGAAQGFVREERTQPITRTAPPQMRPAGGYRGPTVPLPGQPSTAPVQLRLSVGMAAFALLVTAILLTMIVMNLSLWRTSSRNQQQIDALKRSIASVEQTNAMLEDDIKYAMDGDKICNYAVNYLGMRAPTEAQTRYISLTAEAGGGGQ